MRVLMLSWEYPPQVVGGLARHVHGLARGLARQGARVDVLTHAAAGAPAMEVQEGVRVHRVEPYFGQAAEFPAWVTHLNFALAEVGVRLLGQEAEPVVIHAHDWLVAYAGRLLKHAFRLPLVATVHATEEGRMHGLHDATQKYIHDIEWWLTYEAWRVIVCSRAMRDEVLRLFRLPADKVAVIPNGIEPAAPVPAAPGAAGAGGGAAVGTVVGGEDAGAGGGAAAGRTVFHVGRLVPEKGAGVLLEAFPEVLREFPDARLVIAGTGPWEGELRRRAAALGLGDRVQFTGYVDDARLAHLYAGAAVTVVPSTYEPFGIVALEAMQAGTPVVVSDTGGLSEIVEHGVDGRKALPGHPGSLAEQILAVLRDPAGARRMAAAARRKVTSGYTWDGVARATADQYGQVLAEWRQSAWGSAWRPGMATAVVPPEPSASAAPPGLPAVLTGMHQAYLALQEARRLAGEAPPPDPGRYTV